MKIITLCGSLKFKDKMMEVAEKMELLGNCVITPIFSMKTNKDDFTKEELEILGAMHKEKIRISDAILIINVDGYIGASTKSEIEFAESLHKEILYYTDMDF